MPGRPAGGKRRRSHGREEVRDPARLTLRKLRPAYGRLRNLAEAMNSCSVCHSYGGGLCQIVTAD